MNYSFYFVFVVLGFKTRQSVHLSFMISSGETNIQTNGCSATQSYVKYKLQRFEVRFNGARHSET